MASVLSTPAKMSKADWLAEGTRRFGDNYDDWAFVCPICKGVQTIGDFRQYKDRGANPGTAYFNCIGRYQGLNKSAFYDKPTPETRCDYTLGGLIRIPGVIVTDDDGTEHFCFAFADALATLPTEDGQ